MYLFVSPPDAQLHVFEQQIQLAIELRKPLFLHERDAHTQFLEVLQRYRNKLPAVVVHCFTGNKQELLKYLDEGFYIGLTGEMKKL